MAKKQAPAVDALATEVVEEFHVTNEDVTFEDVTGKDTLPDGVVDPADEEPEKPVKTAKSAKVEVDELPEDLKGKTPAQLAKMYKDAQSVIGRQGSELGELRRTADAYIRTHLAPKKEDVKVEPAKALDAVDFFADPTGSVTKAIENHPALKELQGVTKEFAAREVTRQRTEASREFTKNHPDAGEILADERFRSWILKSPVRQAMLLRAHKHYDLDAANEVFNSWKELEAARKPAATTETKEVKSVATKQAARVPTGGNAAPQQGGKGEKIYRRADIIRLMENDPDRYQMMSDEITKAYADGRVR